jgi:hypothetical protein
MSSLAIADRHTAHRPAVASGQQRPSSRDHQIPLHTLTRPSTGARRRAGPAPPPPVRHHPGRRDRPANDQSAPWSWIGRQARRPRSSPDDHAIPPSLLQSWSLRTGPGGSVKHVTRDGIPSKTTATGVYVGNRSPVHRADDRGQRGCDQALELSIVARCGRRFLAVSRGRQWPSVRSACWRWPCHLPPDPFRRLRRRRRRDLAWELRRPRRGDPRCRGATARSSPLMSHRVVPTADVLSAALARQAARSCGPPVLAAPSP